MVGECFHSVEELELYLLLRRTRPSLWNSKRLCNELGVTESVARTALQSLVAKGLIRQPDADSPPQYCYAESGQHPVQLLEALERLHQDNPCDLVALIARQAIERIRQHTHVAFWSLASRQGK